MNLTMIFKQNNYLFHLLSLIILASCSTTSMISVQNLNEILKKDSLKSFEDIYDYQSYFLDDIEKIQKAIDSQMQKYLKEIIKRFYLRKNMILLLIPPKNTLKK